MSKRRLPKTRRTPLCRRMALILLCMMLPAFSASARVYETVRPGMSGEQVRSMQSALNYLGYLEKVDAKFGPLTFTAVKNFQGRQGLYADGLAGNQTLSELYRLAPQFLPLNDPSAGTSPEAGPAPAPAPASQGAQGAAAVFTANQGSLNLRSNASGGNNVIAQIPFGDAVQVNGGSGQWARVTWQGRTGYVLSIYLRFGDGTPIPTQPAVTPAPTEGTADPVPTQAAGTPDPTPAPGGPSDTRTAYVFTQNKGSLNLRNSASNGNNVIAKIPFGAQVTVLTRPGTWSQVSYQGRTGYVMDSFLRHDAPETKPTAQPTADVTPPVSDAGEGIVNTANGRTLNFRSAPVTGQNNLIGQIPFGTRLQILSRTAEWCMVLFQGKQGYVMASFLRFEQMPNPTPVPSPPQTPTPSPTPAPEPGPQDLFPRTLRIGDQGDDVTALQNRLIALKYSCLVTGAYDEMTKQAVMHFQKQNALTQDGIFGSQSASVLLSAAARRGDSPPLSYATLRIDSTDGADKAITAMQQALLALGYLLSVNGRFDIPTHQAVVGFQQRNGLPITGIANPVTQAALYAPGAKGFSTPVAELDAAEGKGQGPSVSQVKLLHWFNDVKKSASAGQKATVYHPASDISFTIRFYSMGNHADSEPATWRDTQLMNRAFGMPSWNINTVYINLPDGRWTLAAMHNRPHLTGAVSENGFGGHLCIHFLRDTDEVNRNDPDYGASNQRAIRKAWQAMTGEAVE